MSKRETYEAKTEELLLPIAEENGVEIYDVIKEGFGRGFEGGLVIHEGERK